MELMSSLLLCALVALLPRALDSTPVLESDVKINDTKIIGQSHIPHKHIFLNSNYPLVSAKSALQNVFTDYNCKKCLNCMERAIKAHQIHTHIQNGTPNVEELANDALDSYHQHKSLRDKRNTGKKGESATNATSTPKNVKPKMSKTVTVSKFSTDGQVYALKVKEGNAESTGQDSDVTCRVYSVKKYHPCDSPEGDLMLTNAKRKASKKNKKDQPKKQPALTTQKPQILTEQISRAAKREVGNTRVVEQYMTSIEELY